MPAERLQKIIAAAGVASRRKAEELITAGRVQVNGQPVTELGAKADAEQDHIRVDGKLLHAPERFSYYVLNKPKGYVTTVSDPEHRPTVMDLVRAIKGRVYPVGRLDWASEGLLLLTNDGALANALMKAASHVPKVYVVKVAGTPDENKLDKLRRGVSIAEKGGRRVRTAPAQIRLIKEGDNPWLEVTIIEGRNRQVRKMFEEVGHHVEKIRRVQYGPLTLDIPPGEHRSLTLEEVANLKAASSGTAPVRHVRPASLPPALRPAAAKPERAKKPFRSPKPAFGKNPFREQKAGFGENPARAQRPAFGKSTSRDRKPAFGRDAVRGSKPAFSKNVSRGQRPAFSTNPADPEKPAFGDKPARSQRPAFGNNVSRGKKPAFGPKPSRAQRPAFGDNSARSQRPAFGKNVSRGQRPAFGENPSRPQKPAFGKNASSGPKSAFSKYASRTRKPGRFQKPTRKRD